MRNFLHECRRRHVDRAAMFYLAAAWLIVQVAETTLPLYDVDDAVIRWVVLLLAIGFLPTLALAWAFQWSPQGLRTQEEADQENANAPAMPASRTGDRVIIVVLALAVTLFAVDRFALRQETSAPTIAVLPFADLTATGDQAYFADGLAEELLNQLARNTSLLVASRTSSFRFRDSQLPLEDIARQLRVDHVVEGSVRRDGERIRVTVQLIEASGGFHLWSNTYDALFEDIFAIEDSMSTQIAEALQASVLGDTATTGEPDPEAYALFLQGRYRAYQGSEEALEAATGFYRQSLAVDAAFPQAWSQLAAVYLNRAASGFIDYDEGYRLAEEAALHAVELDPRYAPAYDKLASVAFWYRADIGDAVTNVNRAVEYWPQNIHALDMPSLLLEALGELDTAIALLETSVERSPVDAIVRNNLALAYLYAGRYADAQREFGQVLALSEDYSAARNHLAEALLLQGRYREALAAWEAETDPAYRDKGRALAYYSLGESERADAALEHFIATWGEQWPSEVSHIHAWRGEPDAAFSWLEQELATYGPGGWGEWKLQPLYAKLHDDPRWQAFLQRVGVSDAQLAKYRIRLALDAGR
ncbi:tetratricopeptide repeat protein [Mangrovimicrobium sediminis]|uniref:Tetratricopeptide repeat protein n=1 Tax=Mangrovimicrobium sediminis TaxID=2562682 RepID=A0A4Z0M1C6_9GAMM|nr:tetratricopeptide repeat protein [Haliea sp. SAOS-164]TGD73329.1 tetratricopeptide repeat protein [Haliea sp. SAOS-164]